MLFESWLLFTAAVMFASITPGPGNLAVMVQSMNHGYSSSIPVICGILAGLFLLGTVTCVGLITTFATSLEIFSVLQYLGAAYLLFLGLQMIFGTSHFDMPEDSHTMKWGKLFFRGFMVAAPNPKSIAFFAVLFPPFINPASSIEWQLVIMLFTMLFFSLVLLLVIALITDKIAPALRRYGQSINRISGCMFVLLAIYLILPERSTPIG